jgi:hypothetical protein
VRELQDVPHDFTGHQMFDNFECKPDNCHDPDECYKMKAFHANFQTYFNNQTVQQNKLSFEREVKKLGSIPKKLYVSWKRKFDVMKHKSALIHQGLQSFVAHNPDWEVEVMDNRDVDSDLRKYLDSIAWETMKDRHIVEKIDLWRLLVIYYRGGMYADIDRLFNLEMKSVIGKETKMLLPFGGLSFNEKGLATRIFDFSQDFVASAPGNPAIKAAIDLSLSKHLEYKICKEKGMEYCLQNTEFGERCMCEDRNFATDKNFLLYAGARLYNRAISTHIFGVEFDNQPSECVSKAVVEHIASLSPHIVTYVEHLPCNTIVAQDGCAHLPPASNVSDVKESDEEKYVAAKKFFYADEGRGRWVDEVAGPPEATLELAP